ncbi:hypothetical protein L249_7703 [Ophiocordyceps polyrhachis-furcata BCC 54312]|uniref:Uncharacterized protein n=1 Tax=Ophiocordyceps polyrhachis-furcata BCC 54312 TaxID=1330021 RepID=A0A367LA03_9HYPO|nr:hypothetical protein L249_7703 [Ophiocordyceps polyrhachis-furcata BCC 54312]
MQNGENDGRRIMRWVERGHGAVRTAARLGRIGYCRNKVIKGRREMRLLAPGPSCCHWPTIVRRAAFSTRDRVARIGSTFTGGGLSFNGLDLCRYAREYPTKCPDPVGTHDDSASRPCREAVRGTVRYPAGG